jgi:hypothetical protein
LLHLRDPALTGGEGAAEQVGHLLQPVDDLPGLFDQGQALGISDLREPLLTLRLHRVRIA